MAYDGFPPLAGWQPTRDTLHRYARVLGAIRGKLTPKQKHWWHVSLHVVPDGLSTTTIPFGAAGFELALDLSAHRLSVRASGEPPCHVPLAGQSAADLGAQIIAALADMGIRPELTVGDFDDATPGNYDRAAAERYGRALFRIDSTLKRFRQELAAGTSPVQLWPHHFDLAMTWFSGRLVPGADPADADSAQEQMSFGFSTGDDILLEPYFYVTAYPLPSALERMTLPPDATWHTQGWQGAVMVYETLIRASRPEEKLLEYFRQIQAAGAKMMTR